MEVRFMEMEPSNLQNTISTATDSLTKCNNDDMQLLQNPAPLQEFDKQDKSKASALIESTLAACVFRKHLKLAKNEEDVITLLSKFVSGYDKSTSNTDQADLPYENVDGHYKTTRVDDASMDRELMDAYYENAISFEDVIAQPNILHKGKILLCINVVLPVLSCVNGSYFWNTVVQDVISGKTCRMEMACSNLHEANLLVTYCKAPYVHNMAPNSTVLLYDPIFQFDSSGETFSFCVNKIGKVVFLGMVSILRKPEIELNIPSENSNEGELKLCSVVVESESSSAEKSKASLWVTSSTCEEKYARDEWKEWGDEHAIGRRMRFKAYVAYNVAQRFDEGNVELAAAKCASLINLGLFLAALKEVEPLLENDPFNSGLITRKIHCLWGLGKYTEAIEYLEGCYKELLMFAESDECQDPVEEIGRKGLFIQKIISKTEKFIMLQQDLGPFNSESYFKHQAQMSPFEPDYQRLVTLKSVIDKVGTARQVAVTNQALPAGTILAKIKAFATVFQNDENDSIKNENVYDDDDDELLNLTLQKLMIESLTQPDRYDIAENKDMMEISKSKAINFYKKHSYSMKSLAHHKASPMDNEVNQVLTVRGVWTFPAYIKHACVGGNAVWCICGNTMFIRSICNINEGEELVMAHVEPTKPFEYRTQFLKNKSIECSCSLCQFERTEPEAIKEKRNEILDALIANISCTNLPLETAVVDLQQLKMRLEDLETLRTAFPKLNFPIVEPLYNTGLYLLKIGSCKEAIYVFEKAFFVVENTSALATLTNLCFLLSYSYMAKKKSTDKNRSKNWYETFKIYANLYYGCLTPVTYKFKTEFEYLKRKGIAS